MSTTYEIYKFAKPTLKELSIVDYYSDYDVFSILDEDGDSTGEFISLFRIDDKSESWNYRNLLQIMIDCMNILDLIKRL